VEPFVHITEAARRLGVTAGYLRLLERTGQISPARRDLNGRIYTEVDIALLRSMGVGSRPSKLRRADEVLERVR
jgi:MerR HTH family regulatory protein